jgi:hypothetical protein
MDKTYTEQWDYLNYQRTLDDTQKNYQDLVLGRNAVFLDLDQRYQNDVVDQTLVTMPLVRICTDFPV